MDFSEISSQIANVASKYNYRKPPDLLIQIQDWVERVLRWIHDFLSAFNISIPGLADTRVASNVMQICLWIGGTICLLLFIYAIWTQLNQLQSKAQLARKGQSLSGEIMDSAAWRQQAKALATQTKWREACRALYFASLRTMDEEKIMQYSPTRTNYEYWYALAQKPSLAKNFRNLSNCVENIWFGKKPAAQADYQATSNYLAAIDQEVMMIKEENAALSISTADGAS